MLEFIITVKGGPTQRRAISDSELSVGRTKDNDIVLAGATVNKRHARIYSQEGKLFIADLKSTNGTFVNGKRIAEMTPLVPPDRVTIGDFLLQVVDPNAMQPHGEPLVGPAGPRTIPAEPRPLLCPNCRGPLEAKSIDMASSTFTCPYCGVQSKL
jgi:pilus assembly protein CpaF